MMFRELKFTLLILLSTVGMGIASIASAQTLPPTVRSSVSPSTVMIGDHFTLSIDVESDIMQQIAFPEFDLEGQDEIEFVEEPQIDTVESNGRRLHLRRRYKLRSFEEGAYNLGRMAVLYIDKNIVDTLYSADSVIFEIQTYLIDSTAMAAGIFDIKPQRNTPFKFAEISTYLKWGLLALLLLIALGYVALRVLAHYGKNVGGLFKPAPPIPPHVRAIEDLEQLHNKKLWQSNKHKLYYSGLTDILRTYISGRYSIMAMEMTTDEIIEAIRNIEMPHKCAMDLQALLRDADLVKFAKATPESDQNESYYNKSYNFVEETKLVEHEEVETTTDDDAPTTESDNEKGEER